MKMSKKQLDRLTYRKQRIQGGLDQIQALFHNYSVSIAPLVRTKSGKHSETRTWKLVEELISALEEYYQLAKPKPLPERRRNFFRSYLYCLIRGVMEAPYPDDPMLPIHFNEMYMGTGTTFQDLLDLGESCYSKLELQRDELIGSASPGQGRLFYVMDTIYENLAGHSISETFSPEERQELERTYREELEEARIRDAIEDELDPQMYEAIMDVEEDDVVNDYYDDTYYEALRKQFPNIPAMDKTALRKAADDAWNKAMEEAHRRACSEWVQNFSHPEVFCQEYEQLRRLYFQESYDRDLDLQWAIDFYLYQHNQSVFMDDDAFFYAYSLMEQVIQKTRDRVGREER